MPRAPKCLPRATRSRVHPPPGSFVLSSLPQPTRLDVSAVSCDEASRDVEGRAMVAPSAIPTCETFVTHLECSETGERYEPDRLHNLSRAGKPLIVRYDLDGVRRALTKEILKSREPSMWRYRELLPVRRTENIASLGEMMTPLIAIRDADGTFGQEVLIKDEGRLPTGSFKARGVALAVSMAK